MTTAARNIDQHAEHFARSVGLRGDYERLSSLMCAQLNASPDGILILDLTGATLLNNHVYEEIWGFTDSQVAERFAGGLLDVPSDVIADPDGFAIDVLRSLGKSQGHGFREIDLLDGRVIEEQTRPLQDADGVRSGRVWFFRDVTTRKIAERQLIFAANLFNRSPEAMALLTPDLYMIQVNKALEERLVYADTELVGQSLSFPDAGHQDAAFYHGIRATLAECGAWEGEIWNRDKNGGVIVHKLSIAPAHDEDGPASEYIAVFSDISAAKQQMDDLRHQAHHDPLTGLPNRALLRDIIPTQLSFANRQKLGLAVILIDLDGFKPINDTHGHRIGDEVLRHVAHCLSNSMRDSDRIFRLGGDEFVVSAVCGPGEIGVDTLCDRILSAISTPLKLEGLELTVGASLGVALYPDHGSTASELLDAADAAMYESKSAGKGCFRISG